MNPHEIEQVASLAGHPGWSAMMRLLDAADEDLLARLEISPAAKETELLYLWRASRRIKRILAGRPETLLDELPKPEYPEIPALSQVIR